MLRPSLVVVMTTSHRLMVPKRKAVASIQNLAVARTISVPQQGPNSKAATASTHSLAAVQIISLRLEVKNLKAAVVCIPNIPAVLTVTLQLLDPITKDVDATLSNSDVALTSSQLPKDLIWKAADVRTLPTDAVKMNERPLMGRNSKAVLVNLPSMVAVLMALHHLRVQISKDVHQSRHFLAKFAHWTRIVALAAISLSIGSSTWNTVVALVSGTVDAMATTIAFRHKTIARLTVWNRPAFRPAHCLEWLDLVKVITHLGTTTQLPARAANSATEAVWVTPTVLPLAKNVTSNVLHQSYSINARSLKMLVVVKVPSGVGVTIRRA